MPIAFAVCQVSLIGARELERPAVGEITYSGACKLSSLFLLRCTLSQEVGALVECRLVVRQCRSPF